MNTSFLNSSIHYEAHQNYIRGVDEHTCRFFRKVNSAIRCEYFKVTPQCTEAVGMFNYGQFIFCDLSKHMTVTLTIAVIILLIVCFFFMLFASVVTVLVIPNVLYIMKAFELGQHNAGTTFMILIYGIPSMVTTVIHYEGDTELLLNEMMGISLYLRAFQSGLLIYNYPFTLYGTFFIRDAIFFGFGIGLLYTIIVDEEQVSSVFQGIFGMVFYPALCYLVYLQHFSTKEARRRAQIQEISEEKKQKLELTKEISFTPFPVGPGDPDPLEVGICQQFYMVANIYNKYNFPNYARWQKIILILGFYFAVPVKLTIPVVHPMAPAYGWSRLLIALNMFLAPFMYFGLSLGGDTKYLVPVIVIAILSSSIFLICTSTNKPRFQMIIAFYGLTIQMWILQICGAEIAAVLLLVGNIVGLRRPVIGTTILAWGDCVPEVIGWLTMTRWKINALPLAAFLIAPLFNMTFTLGGLILKNSIEKRTIHADTRAGDVGQTCTWFTCVHHCAFCFAILCTDFHLRKSVGIYSILVYLLFILYVALNQADIIHSYGTDHNNEELFENANWA